MVLSAPCYPSPSKGKSNRILPLSTHVLHIYAVNRGVAILIGASAHKTCLLESIIRAILLGKDRNMEILEREEETEKMGY